MSQKAPTPNDSPNASQATVGSALHAHALEVGVRLDELRSSIRENESKQQKTDANSLAWNVYQIELIRLRAELKRRESEERNLAKQIEEELHSVESEGEIEQLANRYSVQKFVDKKIDTLQRKLSNLPRQISHGLTKGCQATQKRYASLCDDLVNLMEAMETVDEQEQHLAAAQIVRHHDEKLYTKISQIDEVKNRLLGVFIDAFKAIIPSLKTAGFGDKNHGGDNDQN